MLNDLLTLFEQDSTRQNDDWLKLAELSAHLGNSFVSNAIIERFRDTDSDVFRELDLVLNYEYQSTQSNTFDATGYYSELVLAYDKFGKDKWCNLFGNDLSFQALDNDGVFQVYRSNCISSQNP